MKVRDADGVRWTVRRRWLPWRVRTRNLGDALSSPVGGVPDDPILLALWLVVAIPIILIGVIITLELALLLLLLPVATIARALFIGWTLVVRRGGTVVGTERVKGWRASRARMRVILGEVCDRPPTMLVDTSGDPYQLGPDWKRPDAPSA